MQYLQIFYSDYLSPLPMKRLLATLDRFSFALFQALALMTTYFHLLEASASKSLYKFLLAVSFFDTDIR